MIVTGARDGEVQALIGARDAGDPGFDRALDARRPIGSLIKPFVYLVALAQPQKYSLATPARRFAPSTWCSRTGRTGRRRTTITKPMAGCR